MSPRGLLPELPPLQVPARREYALLGVLLVAALLACFKPLSDPDTYWHLALGRQIWTDHALVRGEAFSFTDPGAEWEDTEWLFHAALYPLWRAGGDLGLRVLTALAGALGIGLAYRCVRLMGGDSAALGLFLLPTLWAYADRIRCRPDAVSVLFAAALCELLVRWHRRDRGRGWEAAALVLLFFLWVQAHGAWTYGMVILWSFIAGRLLDAWRAKGLTPALFGNLVVPGLACVAALFLNPYGWRLPLFPLRAFASFKDPSFLRIAEWTRTPFTGVFGLFAAALLVVLAAILLVRRRFSWSEFLPAASQVALGLYWVRYAAFAVVTLSGSASSRLALLRKFARPKRWLALAGAVCAAGLALAQIPRLSAGYDLAERYPVRETAFLRENVPGGNLLHEFRVGGYLEWSLPASFRVFMDGRFPLFKSAEMDYYQAHRTPEAFLAFLGKYPIDAALYAYQSFQLAPAGGGPPRGPSAVLFPQEGWALVEFGPYGMVLLKRNERNADAIRRFGYTHLRPDDTAFLTWAAGRGEVPREALEAELRRGLGEACPPGVRASLRSALEGLTAKGGEGLAR